MRIPLRRLVVACMALLSPIRVPCQTTGATTFTLVKSDPSARGGSVQVSTRAAGIVITGTVDGAAPRWAASRDRMDQGDRLEISVADVTPSRLPPIGWGHQFGDEILGREEDCRTREFDTTAAGRARCVEWYRRQVSLHSTVARLFLRRWAMTPSIVVETLAQPAFASLDEPARRDMALLEPLGTPQARFMSAPSGVGYTFQVTIPWEALPPMQSIRLSELGVLVDVYAAGAATPARSTIVSTAVAGDPSTFPVVPLSAAREYSVGACRSDFANPVIQHGSATDFQDASDSARVFYRPTAALELRRAIVLDNPAHGYQYEPDSASNAPVAQAADFWAIALGGGETLCGPHLAYRRAAGLTRAEQVIAVTDSLTTRRLANGDVLVKAGPRVFSSYYGSGQCGACPRVGLQIFHLDHSSGAITSAFSFRGIAEPESRDVDIELSPDWGEVTVYEMTADLATGTPIEKWRSTTHCYRPATHTYEQCRESKAARPPSQRRVKPFSLYGRVPNARDATAVTQLSLRLRGVVQGDRQAPG